MVQIKHLKQVSTSETCQQVHNTAKHPYKVYQSFLF